MFGGLLRKKIVVLVLAFFATSGAFMLESSDLNVTDGQLNGRSVGEMMKGGEAFASEGRKLETATFGLG